MASRTSVTSLVDSQFSLQRVNQDRAPFKTLPIELVVYIADFLPPSATASFALSCRGIRLILGNEHLDPLRSKTFNKTPLLDMLLDPECECCLLHHRCLEVRHRNLIRVRDARIPSMVTDEENAVSLYLGKQFHDITFRSVMVLHRRGIHCSKLLCLLSGLDTTYLPGVNYQKVSICRIANGRLLFRHQNWILYRDRKIRDLPPPDSIQLIAYPHVTMFHDFVANKVARRTRHLQDILNSTDHRLVCIACEGLSKCHVCPAEFQIDTKDFSTKGIAVVITRWLDLGDGNTPFDPKWMSCVLKGHYPLRTAVPFPLGSIKQAFQHRLNRYELLIPEFRVSLLRDTPLHEERRESLTIFFERNFE